MKNDYNCTICKEEEKILTEKPYKPLKHFLYDLPDIILFVCKWIACIYILKLFFMISMENLAKELPNFCALLK